MDIVFGVISIVVSVLGPILFYWVKDMNQRINKLETTHTSKLDVRQMIEDKIGGIHSDLRDIKLKIDKLFDIYINNKLR